MPLEPSRFPAFLPARQHPDPATEPMARPLRQSVVQVERLVSGALRTPGSGSR